MGPRKSITGRYTPSWHVHLLACCVGIFGSLTTYGVLQERLMTGHFGTQREIFGYSLFLVLVNRLVSCLIAICALLLQGLHLRPAAPLQAYALVSMSNVAATTCQYEALKYVSFPLQTLGKCAKMIPVMVWGSFIAGKTYRMRDYAAAAATSLGCTLFVISGEVKSDIAATNSYPTLYGFVLMTGYLVSDGFTSTFQSKLFDGYRMSIYNQILHTTLFSAAFSLAGLISSQQLFGAVEFVFRHPDCLTLIILLSAASTSGQLCILHTVKRFGPLVFATLSTLRQFLSILMSCILFAHPLSHRQWIGTTVVLSAVLMTYRRKTS